MTITSRRDPRRYATLTDTHEGVVVTVCHLKLIECGAVDAPFHAVLDAVYAELN